MYKFIALIAFVVFFMAGLVAFKDDITAENLKYLFKYINCLKACMFPIIFYSEFFIS